ncbi:uncharacterized protein LOC114121223 isoform X34 [Aphis gossypii]|uniref:uncharacterized protein LOC114121223 isoform X32 n=1 Tax=Aphis gossypii TaxID=80765 RepID=UPI002158F329|nr:uncharacterized protein LOC114121223 isoform X32 [Aphis gossypii]XP_050059015.1 uncharacterized protein LOC114121223 isoform X33 [Aphis gossypii]XP_050059016.1 uncharacterized protein LOC114121223 isoform X34 [Aphis gossypii]
MFFLFQLIQFFRRKIYCKMQLLCILIFIGVAQCDDSTIAPTNFEHLCAPNVIEFAMYYQLSVQTSFITSCECMLSSNYYIQSGFNEINQGSNDIATNLITTFKNGIGNSKNMIQDLQTDLDTDMKEKLNAVLYMTASYYQKKVIVKKTEITLGEVTDIKQAHTILTARRCERDYKCFVNDIARVKSQYSSGQSNSNNIDKNQWATLVKQYYEARETIINKTDVYTSIREAFLLGSGINLCEGSSNFDQSKLGIYKTAHLGDYFGKKDNNPCTLLNQTATQMYYIYKSSLTAIYLNSVVHSKCDLALRFMIWEHVNLVRAHFELMCKNIDMFIKSTQTEAESTFGTDSENYKKIMKALYICVNEMLITAVKSTEISYRRGLNFNTDRNMIKSDFNQYKPEHINKYYSKILGVNANVARFDSRIIDQKTCSLPTKEMCIPQKMFSSLSNRLIFQSFVCQFNYLIITIKTTEYDTTSVDYWVFEKITLIKLKNSIVFARCSATANKILIMNSAFYAYDLIITENNTPSTEIQQILDQISLDVVGILCIHSEEIIVISDTIDVYIDTNSNNKNVPAVVYKPGFNEYTGQNPKGTPSPNSSGNPTYPNGSGNPTSPNGSGNPTSPNGSGNPTSPNGSGNPTSPNGSGNPTSPNGSGNPTSPNGSGNPTSPNGSGNPTYPGSTTYPGSNYEDIDYSFITSGIQVTQSIENFQLSIECKVEKSLTYVQEKEQNEYTKVVIQSLKISQQIYQCNVEYLKSVVSDSIQFISKEITTDSDESIFAFIILYKDTQEKLAILSSTMEIPLKRTVYSVDTTEYLNVSQTVDYGDYIQSFYAYFEVCYEEVYNNQNDAELFLKNSMTQFNAIYEKVVEAVQSAPDDAYKTFLLSYLQKTLTVYTKTSDYFKEQIVQAKDIVSKGGDISKCALFQEIRQRSETVIVIYSAVLIKCYQYAKDSKIVTINNSEFDVITIQTQVVSSYTEITKTSSTKTFEIEIST